MWLVVVVVAFADPPDPTWVEAVVAGWTSVPAEGRIDALESMVGAETDDSRKSALIALGRLEQRWPTDRPAEDHAAYTRALLLAPDAGRRSYVVAAAGFGAALDPEGLPTMTVAQARTLYVDRRLAPGVVEWIACGPRSGPLGALQRPDEDGGSWQMGDLAPYRERRRPTTAIAREPFRDSRCGTDGFDAGAGLGWTMFEGSRPARLARELEGGPSRCDGLRVRVIRQPIRMPDGSMQGGGEVVDVVMPARVQDCGTPADWTAYADERNAALASELQIDPKEVADLDASPSTLTGFRACAAKRPKDTIRELCAIE